MNDQHREQFQTILAEWAAAIVANDAERIGAFAEPDWVIVGPEGGPGSRDGFLAFVASGDLTHSEMAFEVLDARVYGDVAIVLAHGTNQGTWQGEPFGADEWITDVFVRRGETWRCAMSALTPNYAAPINAGRGLPTSDQGHAMPTITPILLYQDVASALQFLTRAFGFEETLRYNDPAGYVSHAEMRFGRRTIMLGGPGDDYRNPAQLGTTTVHVHVDVDDVDALHARALDAGAEEVSEPEDHAYGQRACTVRDPEGHVWTFGQTIELVAPEEWGAVTP